MVSVAGFSKNVPHGIDRSSSYRALGTTISSALSFIRRKGAIRCVEFHQTNELGVSTDIPLVVQDSICYLTHIKTRATATGRKMKHQKDNITHNTELGPDIPWQQTGLSHCDPPWPEDRLSTIN